MKRKTAVAPKPEPGKPTHLAAVESVIFERLPSLVAHCAVTAYEDGSARKTGWLTVKVMGTTWIVQVKDPDGAVSLSATGPTLDDALTLADLLVGSDEAPWEADPFLQRTTGPKKK